MRGKLQFVAQCARHEIVRRSALCIAGHTDQAGGIVLDGSHHALLLRIPPLICSDAVSAAVGAGEQGGMPGGRSRVGVVVVAVREIGTTIEQQAKPTLHELIAIPLQVVTTKLVNHDDDNQLGMTVVGGSIRQASERGTKQGVSQQAGKQRSEGAFHRVGSLQPACRRTKANKVW